ncbi:MAG: MoxR family ATPase [Gammaproteobacteria bacterium]|nr:MoxR family ATPase [Gammaproteobacteria bacterium]
MLLVRLGRPLLLEGDAGVGKTAVAQALSEAFTCSLIRLQCYEGLDANAAVYEWNYPHQLLALKLHEQAGYEPARKEAEIFSERFLLPRPLLKAITQEQSPVLLIDEVDRADEAFEAYLLEVLSDFQISIPELGTIKARSIPYVVLTSNGARELSDALRRRCLFHYLDYPDIGKELAIVNRRLPHIDEHLAAQIVQFVHRLRATDLRKKPGIAETLDWAVALLSLDIRKLDDDPQILRDTLGSLLKTQEDLGRVDGPFLATLMAPLT